jgi:hypothetical protein
MIDKVKAKKLLDKLLSKEEEEELIVDPIDSQDVDLEAEVEELEDEVLDLEAEVEELEAEDPAEEEVVEEEVVEEAEEDELDEEDEEDEEANMFDLDNLSDDEFGDDLDEEELDADAELSSEQDLYKTALADLSNEFNSKNEKTPYNLFVYAPSDEHFKSFKIGFETDDTMIYFDNSDYDEGKVDLKFNDVFYGELDAIAKDVGIRRIEWSDNDEGVYGTITL